MRNKALLATAAVLTASGAVHAQSFVYGVGPGGPRYYYAPGTGAYSARSLVGPAARPYYARTNQGLLSYNPRDGYFFSPSYGLPWSAPGYPNAPIDRRYNNAYSRGGVVRYSRPDVDAMDAYYARGALALPEPNPNYPNSMLEPAHAEADEMPMQKPNPLLVARSRVGTGGATRKATATRRPASTSHAGSSGAIRASGGADWVPSVPSRW